MIPPKVTIILPVYNVEEYLRECLDSVVNQTMQEIQIICVNDGSTDASPATLEEYAAKDPRIEIVHQANQGGGSARNAAYLHIRGKYAYFVDPDDWLDLDLCKQCWDKAEATETDFVALRHIEHRSDRPDPTHSVPYDSALPEIRQSPEEKREIFKNTSTWRKFWQSDFLLSNNIRFSEGKRPYNDVFAAWKGTVLANRIAVLDRPLYHYRIRPGSYQQANKEKLFIVVETYDDVEKMLHETKLYESYKFIFFEEKLQRCLFNYHRMPRSHRSKFLRHVRQYRTEDEREFFRTAPVELVPENLRAFHKMIDGGMLALLNYYYVTRVRGTPKRQLLQSISKKITAR